MIPTASVPAPRASSNVTASLRSNVRISGPRLRGRPLLDRIDIHIEVPRVAYDKLANATRGEPSADICACINAARARQQQRLTETGMACNADMGPAQIREFCAPRCARCT